MSTLPSAYDANRLAVDMLEILPQSADILRATWAADDYGNRTATWDVVATVPVRLGAARFNEAEKDIAERFRNMQVFRVSFVVGTDIRITDRIDVDGLLLSVEGIHFPKSVEIERIVLCVEAAQ